MRTRLGMHLAGLLAAAGSALTADDLARLAGRRDAHVRALLPDATTEDIEVAGDTWRLRGDDAVARVVRNLHAGPLAPGVERQPRVRERALAPFRDALLAAIASARDEWGWESAPAFALSDGFVRALAERPADRRALVGLVVDPGRAAVMTAAHPDAARIQLREVAAHVARTATSGDDLVDLAALLLAAARLDAVGGAVPRRLAPVFALFGDTERAAALAHDVRTDASIELAYVASAAAQAGAADADVDGLLDDVLSAIPDDAPAGALLRTAQAVVGAALHLPFDAAHARAVQARHLVDRAFAPSDQPSSVEGLRMRQFRASRDQEQALGATTLATAAVVLAQAGDPDGASRATADARAAGATIVDDLRRCVLLAEIATRLAVRTAPTAPALLDHAAAEAADAALEVPDDIAGLARIARLLSATGLPEGDNPERPAVVDVARARRAAQRALALILASEGPPPRGALRDVAHVLTGSAASASLAAAAHGVAAAVAATRHGTALERRTRARTEAVVLAEAAVVLSAGEAAVAAARAALDVVARVPAPARARPLAELADVLLDADDDAVFAVGLEAAAHVRTVAEGRGDPGADALIATAALRMLATPAAPHAAAAERLLEVSVLALRRAEHTASLTLLADLAARTGQSTRAKGLAVDALRSAHAADPVRRRRALAAIEAAESALAGGSTPPLRVPGTAASWLADGYPLEDLPALAAADPESARRVIRALRADLDR